MITLESLSMLLTLSTFQIQMSVAISMTTQKLHVTPAFSQVVNLNTLEISFIATLRVKTMDIQDQIQDQPLAKCLEELQYAKTTLVFVHIAYQVAQVI